MSANRLTSVLYPFKHKKIWEENNGRNLKLAIGLILSLDFLSQCHSITFIFLWGWKDASLGYPQIPGFDAWHRLYYAVTVSTVALICLVMNLLTIWEMRGLTERKYQWSLFGISILSTLMQIPAALFFTALSYAAFTGNQLSVASLIASFSSVVALFVGNYQPYWLLLTSRELRKEIYLNLRKITGLVVEGQRSIHTLESLTRTF